MDDEDSSEVIMRCVGVPFVREDDVKEVFTRVRHSSRITSDVGSTASDGRPPLPTETLVLPIH